MGYDYENLPDGWFGHLSALRYDCK